MGRRPGGRRVSGAQTRRADDGAVPRTWLCRSDVRSHQSLDVVRFCQRERESTKSVLFVMVVAESALRDREA
eukprot:SAG31_NODE_27825_length_419_cov_1.171875_2_plen_71_part_01